MKLNLKPGSIVRHYKNKVYLIEHVGAIHTESMEKMVVYRSLYPHLKFKDFQVWVRPEKMFRETINIQNKEIPRFTVIQE